MINIRKFIFQIVGINIQIYLQKLVKSFHILADSKSSETHGPPN